MVHITIHFQQIPKFSVYEILMLVYLIRCPFRLSRVICGLQELSNLAFIYKVVFLQVFYPPNEVFCRETCKYVERLQLNKIILHGKKTSHFPRRWVIAWFQNRSGMRIFFLFLHKTIYCGYSLEAPQRGASNEYPQYMFLRRNKKNISIFQLK